jgi:GNAT superfamily N-acetyltransferase
MNFLIRSAHSHDITALCALYHEFHEFHVCGVPDRLQSAYTSKDPDEDRELAAKLKKIIEDDKAKIFVADIDNHIGGLAEVYIRQDEPNPLRKCYKYAYLQSLIVSEAYREHGIGIQLLTSCEKWARQRNATEMRLDTWEFEKGPLHFYERQGYRTLRRTMVRKL